MDKISVVMPLHNEALMLPYSLPQIFLLNPNEIIMLLDRCTDNSFIVAKTLAKKYGYKNLRFIAVKEANPSWHNRIAYLRRLGYTLAKNSIILDVDADIILDTEAIKNGLKLLNDKTALITYGFLDYPYTVQCFLRAFFGLFCSSLVGGNLHAFTRKAWLKSEDQELVKDIVRGQDNYLRKTIRENYKHRYKFTHSLHLRPSEGKEHNEKRGMSHALLGEKSRLKMFAHSLFMLRPNVFVNFIRTKRGSP